MNPFIGGLLDLLAPPNCAGCDLPTDKAGLAFCDACSPLLELVPTTLRAPGATAAALCYQGPLADAIRRLKYRDRPELATSLGQLLASAATPYAGLVDRVVPVPLHRSKLRERGYNPAALLARATARQLGVALDTSCLARVRATRTQAELPAQLRADNVRGAFAARQLERPQRILLIDDVRTTGATLHEAAAALSSTGHTVLTLALAWAA